MTLVRYVGRHGRDVPPASATVRDVADNFSGPETTDRFFSGSCGAILDPLSFPWHLVSAEQLRQPLLVDLTGISDLDQVALTQVLPALTPDDLVVAEDRHVEWLRNELHVPAAAISETPPVDIATHLSHKTLSKLRTALLREVLGPTIERELLDARGPEPSSSAAVIGTDDDYEWFAGLVSTPHSYALQRRDELAERSADLLLCPAHDLVDADLNKTFAALRAGGLLLVIFDASDFSEHGPRASVIVEKARHALDGAMLLDHVWGLHERPGSQTHGGILGIRPLGSSS